MASARLVDPLVRSFLVRPLRVPVEQPKAMEVADEFRRRFWRG